MNNCRLAELRHKEVINSTNGCRIGFADDIEIDTETARVVAVVIYGRQRFFGFFGRGEDIVIRWENISLIGEDTILVTHCPLGTRRIKKPRLPMLPFLH